MKKKNEKRKMKKKKKQKKKITRKKLFEDSFGCKKQHQYHISHLINTKAIFHHFLMSYTNSS